MALLYLNFNLHAKMFKLTFFMLIVILLPQCLSLKCCDTNVAEKVDDFTKDLGWKVVTIVMVDYAALASSRHFLQLMLKQTRETHIKLTTLAELKAKSDNRYIQEGKFVFVIDQHNKGDGFKDAVSIMKQTSAFSILMLSHDTSALHRLVDTPLGYYNMDINHKDPNIERVTVTREKNDTGFSFHVSPRLQNLEDLENAHMKIKTMPYSPYLFMEGCELDHECQKASGKAYDILDFIAKEFNFTFSIHMEPSQMWGAAPGPNGTSNDSSGVFGSILDGTNDFPLSLWYIYPERYGWVDFVMPFENTELRCFANMKGFSSRDLAFFIMPLTKKAWALVITLAILVIAGENVLNVYFQGKLIGKQLWITIGGIACALITSYYSGAQTMFLTSEITIPFETICEGLTEAPGWDFMIAKGDEDTYSTRYPDQSFDGDHIVELDKGLVMLASGQSRDFLVAGSQRVYSELSRIGSNVDEDLVEFCNPLLRIGTFILPRSSPFKAAINRGIMKLHQMGMLPILGRRWAGAAADSLDKDLGPMASGINFWQMMLVIHCGCGVVGLVVCILLLEKTFKWMREERKVQKVL